MFTHVVRRDRAAEDRGPEKQNVARKVGVILARILP